MMHRGWAGGTSVCAHACGEKLTCDTLFTGGSLVVVLADCPLPLIKYLRVCLVCTGHVHLLISVTVLVTNLLLPVGGSGSFCPLSSPHTEVFFSLPVRVPSTTNLFLLVHIPMRAAYIPKGANSSLSCTRMAGICNTFGSNC